MIFTLGDVGVGIQEIDPKGRLWSAVADDIFFNTIGLANFFNIFSLPTTKFELV